MANIRDVAGEAGLSIASVSRVLNDPTYGSAETRNRVMRAVKRLGYRPNNIAQSMVRGRTNILALIIPDVRNPFFTSVARGLEDAALEKGYRVMLCNTDEDIGRQRNYLEVVRSKIVDGFAISVASDDDKAFRGICAEETPFVFIDRTCPGITADAVVVDNRAGARAAVEHLRSLGHDRIGMIAGKRDTLPGRERLEGYLEASGGGEELVRDGGFTMQGGYEATQSLIRERPTAIFVSNNAMTIGCLRALAEARIKVPDEVGLVGFDDSEWAEFFTPPLTVVRQPTYEMGKLAGDLLLSRLGGSLSEECKRIVLKPELVIRRSCGAGL